MWKIADIEKNKIKYFENAASGKTITNIMDCIDYANAMSREIYLNNLTPASAEEIDKIIEQMIASRDENKDVERI